MYIYIYIYIPLSFRLEGKNHTQTDTPHPHNRFLPRLVLQKTAVDDPRASNLQSFQVCYQFVLTPKSSTSYIISKTIQNLKRLIRWPQIVQFWSIWDAFWDPFSFKFRDLLNLLDCNKYNAKPCFLQFRASHFGIKNQSTNHVVSNPFLGPHFSRFMLIFIKKAHFRDPFKIQWAPQWVPKSTKWCPRAPKKYPGRSLFRGPETDQRPRRPPNAIRAPNEWLFKPLGTLLVPFWMIS